MRTIDVGTRGYDYADGGAGFYDPDLPTDWRFLYYCNQLRALLLAADETASFIGGALPELVDDSDDDFRFTVELHWPPPDVDRAVEALGLLGSRLAGIVVVPAARARESATALAAMRRRWPMCVDAGGAAPDLARELAGELGVATVWRPLEQSSAPEAGGLLVARIGDVADATVRPVLETLARRTACGDAAGLFCDAPARAAQAAIRYRVLAELMGV